MYDVDAAYPNNHKLNQSCDSSLSLVMISSVTFVVVHEPNQIRTQVTTTSTGIEYMCMYGDFAKTCCQSLHITVRLLHTRELGMINDPVHDCLEGSWRIGEAKGKHPEVVVGKMSPKGSLRPVKLLQQCAMPLEAIGSIKACEILAPCSLSNISSIWGKE